MPSIPTRERGGHLQLVVRGARRPQVLIVDSDLGRQATLCVALGTRYEPEAAASSVEAIDRAGVRRFELAVVDAAVVDGALGRVVGLLRHRVPRARIVLIAGRRHLGARHRADVLGLDAVLASARTRGLLEQVRTLAGHAAAGAVAPSVGRAIDLMAADVTHLLDVESLAEAARSTLTQLDWDFRAAVGLGVHEYVMRVRVVVARRLLRDTALDVETLAGLLGFADGAELATMIL